MVRLEKVLSAARDRMAEGEVAGAARLLSDAWLTVKVDAWPPDPVGRRSVSLETGMATRELAVWRALNQAGPTPRSLDRHVDALDALAGLYRARGMSDAATGCLVEAMELRFTHGDIAGVASLLRDMGTFALVTGDLDTAAVKLTRALEVWGELSDGPTTSRRRAECRVLLGRVRRAQGDDDSAQRLFEEALTDLVDDDAVDEVRAALAALRSGKPLPALVVLNAEGFGWPTWAAASTSTRRWSADHA